jgi:esterase/lipase
MNLPSERGMRMPSSPDTIVLIHGYWVTPRSWEHSKSHFEAKGYMVHAPGPRVRGRGRGPSCI